MRSYRKFRPARRRASALGSAVLLTGIALAATAGTARAASAPYADPAVSGQIGLCDQAGRLVTSGTLDAQPFVWRAVSSTPAPAEYAGSGRKATLYAYQPRPDIPADQWSGDQLTATSDYSNPRAPMAQATRDDFTLATFMGEFRPMVDGLYQLRMYFGIPGQSTLNTSYPATDIQISGNTWHALQTPNVSCTAGTSRSSELDTIPPLPGAAGSTSAVSGRQTPTATATGSRPAASTSSSRSAASPTTAASGHPSSSSSAASAVLDARPTSAKSSSTGFRVAIVAAVLVLLAAAGGGWWSWRSRDRG